VGTAASCTEGDFCFRGELATVIQCATASLSLLYNKITILKLEITH
jgi:hypothetical protein